LDAQLAIALVGGETAHEQISQLVDHGLVQFTAGSDAPYSVPEPLRDIGVSMIGDVERLHALDRLCDDCLARAQALALPTPTTPAGGRLEDLLQRELPWHRQCLDHLVEIGDDRRALDLAAALDLQLYSLGWWEENLEFQDRALAIPGPPSAARAHVHAVRGRPGQFHQFDEEHNQIALAMAIETGDLASRARAHYHLGVMRWWAGQYDDALAMFELARADAEELGDLFLTGESTRFTGMTLVTAGQSERGLEIQLELIHLVERIGGLEMLLPHLHMHLGHSRRHVGDADAAVADLGRARFGFEALGNRASLIHVCAGLAEVYADLGRYDDALEAAGRSLDVASGSIMDVYDPWTLCTTARVHVALGDGDLARRAASRAIDALGVTFEGETHRVALELAYVASELAEHRAALRLAGLADATPDRRELPFRSPLERQRLHDAKAAARGALGAEADAIYAAGARSSVAEAAALLTPPR
jgi:tetratricopeptide (TPR) repeat protein